MRSLPKYLGTIFLSLFLLLSFVIVPQANAASGPTLFQEVTGKGQPKTIYDYEQEFCDKRSGDLMNLETWYSGKCKEGVDTLSGEGVGFSDIIILQGFEYLIGPQYHGFLDTMLRMIKGLKDLQTGQAANPSAYISNPSNTMDQGLIPGLSKIAALLVTVKPASTVDYLAYVSNNLKSHHVINEAFAAGPGYGYTSLSPILPIWRAFRNVSYLLFALGFVLYGMMIMFRVKIDSKTAATIQLAIPRLIGTLLIITFSYALVGFLIDISTVITAMFINVLQAGGILVFTKHPLVEAAGGLYGGALASMAVNGLMALIVSPFIVFNLLIGGAIGAVIGGIVGTLSITPTLGFFGIIVVIIILIAVVIGYFKLILKLFQAFFSVIVGLIFAPLVLLGNLLPGSDSFGSWLRTIYGNLAVFPVAAFFLVLSYALMAQALLSFIPTLVNSQAGVIGAAASAAGINLGDLSQQGMEVILGVKTLSNLNNIWTPPLTIGLGTTGAGANQAVGGVVGGSLGSLMLATIGFGLLLMSSKYVEMVEKALKTPPFPYGAAIGEALRGGLSGNEWLASRGYPFLPSRLTSMYGPSTPGAKPTIGAKPSDQGGINLQKPLG